MNQRDHIFSNLLFINLNKQIHHNPESKAVCDCLEIENIKRKEIK